MKFHKWIADIKKKKSILKMYDSLSKSGII